MKKGGRVLLYNMNPARARQVQLVCVRAGVRVSLVDAASFGEKIGALAGLTGFEPAGEAYEGETFTDEMMVMIGLSGPDLDRFLNTFRSMKVASVALKCVLTPVNSTWTSVQLHEELSKERASIQDYLSRKEAEKAGQAEKKGDH